jgi:hypothetical protein
MACREPLPFCGDHIDRLQQRKNLEIQPVNFPTFQGHILPPLSALMSTIHRMDEPASSRRRSLPHPQCVLATMNATGPSQRASAMCLDVSVENECHAASTTMPARFMMEPLPVAAGAPPVRRQQSSLLPQTTP